MHAISRRALLVDDSPFFRNLVAPLLASANWNVTTASDGVEALKLREDGQQFDVIISDIEMPNLDGLALASAIRGDTRWSQVPLIALSSMPRKAISAPGAAPASTTISPNPTRPACRKSRPAPCAWPSPTATDPVTTNGGHHE